MEQSSRSRRRSRRRRRSSTSLPPIRAPWGTTHAVGAGVSVKMPQVPFLRRGADASAARYIMTQLVYVYVICIFICWSLSDGHMDEWSIVSLPLLLLLLLLILYYFYYHYHYYCVVCLCGCRRGADAAAARPYAARIYKDLYAGHALTHR